MEDGADGFRMTKAADLSRDQSYVLYPIPREQLGSTLFPLGGLTKDQVREIAARCGYTDQHYFSYCFKKYCGESPNAMRRRLDAERAGEAP